MAVQDTDAPTPACQDVERLAAWLRLANSPGVSRHAAFELLQFYQSPQAVFSAANLLLAGPPARNDAEPPARAHATDDTEAAFGPAPAQSRARPWNWLPRFEPDGAGERLSRQAARLLAGPMPERFLRLAEATLEWASRPGNHVLRLGDAAYPPSLRHIADPPLLLHAKGDPGLLQREAVAVVGARKATTQGTANARAFAETLSRAGLLVVSGLALGIDAAAHEGGLAGHGGTVAVIGTGIDRIYPRRNAGLARRIAEEGCLLSEFALGTHARAEHFPIRNRIIAGMARATLVVEAAAKSGSLITAYAALEAGREVFVLPGSVHAPQSVGCHDLIRSGGRLVASPGHLLEDLGVGPGGVPGMAGGVGDGALDELARGLLQALGYDPVGADELATRLQLDPSDMQASLLTLELAGVVERLPGGTFQRVRAP
ncbi:DNA-protecting protein DprA [Pseudoduganella sp. DS3]|uniref:DNA-protecting protein DprA n=1 Tax=Pseudoduganella guangdongensis TaxID=2692179 RepID=A0A6N9HML7_9BURK|nr:DNA-processing protein DprA [Pseudoduganella guangdongensis]MYN04616.1 DNA-protecting protein DprA [Pseudoduganella guangdongensis]